MRIAITGAAGNIGRQLVEELSGSHDLRLIDRRPFPGRACIVADVARPIGVRGWRRRLGFRPPRWVRALEGADVLVHLITLPAPRSLRASWEELAGDNAQATWNALEAAAGQGVPRVVYASSNWAVKALERELAPACYAPGGPRIAADAPARPAKAYGLSKAFGEIAGRMFVDAGQLRSFLAVRIGCYEPVPPEDGEARHRWIGSQDLRSLFRRCVEAPYEGFHIVYGVSAQPTAPYDLSHTRRLLAWKPQQALSSGGD